MDDDVVQFLCSTSTYELTSCLTMGHIRPILIAAAAS